MLTAQAKLTTRLFLLLMLSAATLAVGLFQKRCQVAGTSCQALASRGTYVPVENKAKLEAAVPNLYDPKKVFSLTTMCS